MAGFVLRMSSGLMNDMNGVLARYRLNKVELACCGFNGEMDTVPVGFTVAN